jgi:hypothetical protein
MKLYLSDPDNREKHLARVRKNDKIRLALLKAYIVDHLTNHPCVDCGEMDLDVLDFDHVRGVKTDNVSSLVRRKVGIDKLQIEIEKCEVRCANCHRRITRKRERESR